MDEDTQLDVEAEMAEVDLNAADSAPPAEAKKKREKKEQQPLSREPGKSLFPHSRVQKIIKADKARRRLFPSLYSTLTPSCRRSPLLQRTRRSSCLWRLRHSSNPYAKLHKELLRRRSD